MSVLALMRPSAANKGHPHHYVILPPLWEIVAAFLDEVDRWYYATPCPVEGGEIVCEAPVLPGLARLPSAGQKEMEKIVWAVLNRGLDYMLPTLGVDLVCASLDMVKGLNRPEIMDWVLQADPEAVTRHYAGGFCNPAVAANSPEIYVWEIENGFRNANSCDILVQCGHFEAFKRLWEPCLAFWNERTYFQAVSSGCVEMVEWIEKHKPSITTKVAVETQISTVEMLEHFLALHADRGDLADFIAILARSCPMSMFDHVLNHVISAHVSFDVVAWLDIISAGAERIVAALDAGFPLPRPNYEPYGFEIETILRDHGWVPGGVLGAN